MFVRTKIVKVAGRTYEYLQVVESYREDGNTRQRVVKSLGRRDQIDPRMIEALIGSLRRYFPTGDGKSPGLPTTIESPDDVEVLESRRFGDVFALRRLWGELGLQAIFEDLSRSREFQFSVADAIFTMVANRAIDPRSKLDTIEWARLDVLLPESAGLNESHLYRTLTWLDEVKGDAEKRIFAEVVKPRSLEAQLVLYDTSPVHFETDAGPALAEHGRPSRAPRAEKIVLVAMVTTFDGWPIYHHVFPGSTADVSTVEPVLKALHEDFKIGRVVVIADNGMVSKKTLALLDQLGFDYILAMKLKQGTKEVNESVLGRPGRYRPVDPNLRVKEVVIEGRRYVMCHNPDEERRDLARRMSILEKLRSELEGGVSWTSEGGIKIRANAAFRRYITPGRGEQKGLITISERRVKEDARYDGKWVVRTSKQDLPPEDIACLFKREGEIEHDWRDLKSVLGLRPVRHRKGENVRGHVFVCVLAKILLRELERRIDSRFAPVGSPPTVLENLGRIPIVQLAVPGRTLWKTARLKPEDQALLRIVGIDPASFPRLVEDVPPVMPSRFAAPPAFAAASSIAP
jgi:hypothetical protein